MTKQSVKRKTARCLRAAPAVALAVVLAALNCFGLCACLRTEAPQLDDVREELTALIDASAQVNTVLFGTGLPVYAPGSDADKLFALYDTAEPDYYYVTYDCEIDSTETIRTLAHSVYASDYIDPILSVMLDGAIVSAGSGTSEQALLHADYVDSTNGFMAAADRTVYITDNRVYLYDTMAVNKKSTGIILYVDVDTYMPDAPDDILSVQLSFVKEDGAWKLNTPTY